MVKYQNDIMCSDSIILEIAIDSILLYVFFVVIYQPFFKDTKYILTQKWITNY